MSKTSKSELLTEQLMIKMTVAHDQALTRAVNNFNKIENKDCSKVEFVRGILADYCFLNQQGDQLEHAVLHKPKLIMDEIGKPLFTAFLQGFSICNTLQTEMSLYALNEYLNHNPVAERRNRMHIFLNIVCYIFNFQSILIKIIELLQSNIKYKEVCSSISFAKTLTLKAEITNNPNYERIAKFMEPGNVAAYESGLDDMCKNDTFILSYMLTSHDGMEIKSNDIMFLIDNLLFTSLKMEIADWEKLIPHTLTVLKDGIDHFQLLFYLVSKTNPVEDAIRRENIDHIG